MISNLFKKIEFNILFQYIFGMLKISINECNNLENNFAKNFEIQVYEEEIEKYFDIIRNKKYYNEDILQDIKKVRELRKTYLNCTGKHYKPIIKY